MTVLRCLCQSLFVLSLSGCAPLAIDISPDLKNTAPSVEASYAGLTIEIAGTERTLFAVSLNAGVWTESNGGAWRQLSKSPAQAQTIAVDPNDESHVLVGERAGFSTSENLNQAGLWETFDGGGTWQYVFNPLTANCLTQTQEITSVAFDGLSNAFAGTACGVAYRNAGDVANGVFAMMSGAGAPTGTITAVATASNGHKKPWVWARTVDTFFLYLEDTGTWTQTAITTAVGGDKVIRGQIGDDSALAAGGSKAYTVVSVDQIRPAGANPSTCPATTLPINAVLTLDADSPAPSNWSLSILQGGSGTGLGGRRFIRAFERTGDQTKLLVGTGQNVFLGTDANFSLTWLQVAETLWSPTGCDHYSLTKISDMHTDIWDARLGTDADPSYWIAGDGGVYRGLLSLAVAAPNGESPAYVQQNEGLHTHSIHSVSIVKDAAHGDARLIYSTSDNGSWARDVRSAGVYPWVNLGGLGDSNATYSDAAGPAHAISYLNQNNAMFYRYLDAADLCHQQSNPTRPLCSGGLFTLTNNAPGTGTDANYEFINLIQTPAWDTPSSSLDVAALVQQQDSTLALMRATDFSLSPSVPNPLNTDSTNLPPLLSPTWVTVDSKLPATGATRVWTTGGHGATEYFLYIGGSAPALWHRDQKGNWSSLNASIVDTLIPSYEGASGPAFVDPYVSGRMFVLTASGVRYAASGAQTFDQDPVLTALISASGTYPMSGNFPGARDPLSHFDHVDDHNNPTGSRAITLASLGHVAFDRNNPNHFVAVAPFVGAFYWRNGVWYDLTPLLPTPMPAISSAAITEKYIYLSTEGRGLFEILNYDNAPMASYFARSSLLQGQLARLFAADGSHASGRQVSVIITLFNGQIVSQSTAVTDASGAVPTPDALLASGSATRVVHLRFDGVTGFGPASVHFTYPF